MQLKQQTSGHNNIPLLVVQYYHGISNHHYVDETSTIARRFEDAKCYLRQQYFEALHTARGELEKRFHQTRGMSAAAAGPAAVVRPVRPWLYRFLHEEEKWRRLV